MRSGPATLVIAWAAMTLVACSSSHRSASRRVVVTATGRIGPLRVDESDRADVIAFAGRPESEQRGRYDSYARFDALGYSCTGKPAPDGLGTPRCETLFYLDVRSGKLELLITEDDRYADVHGVHVGMPTATAERLLHRRVLVGCDAYVFVETRPAFLVLWLAGGKTKTRRSHHLVGGHVGFLVVHSHNQRRNPGVLDCIDS